MNLTIQYIILIASLFGSGFFSGSEIAFTALSRAKAYQLLEQNKRGAKIVVKLKEQMHKLIITILIGNNILNILASSLATTIAINQFGSTGVGIAVGVMTFLILVFGEIVPKSYAASHSASLCLKAGPILYFLMIIFTPLVIFFETLNKIIFWIFGAKQAPSKLTAQDIMNTIALSEADGAIRARERELLNNVLEFKETVAKEIMTPREEMFVLEDKTPFKEALDAMIDKGYSRVPVIKETTDNIVGVLHIKDAFKALADGKTIRTIKRLAEEPYFIPEAKTTQSLLKDFQKRKQHLAIVVNEYGGVSGMVTMEDLLEELVGDIFDETDTVEHDIQKVNKKEFLAKGSCEIEEFNKKIVDIIPEGEYQTIAGFLIAHCEHVPKKGDQIRYKSLKFTIEKATKQKLNLINVKLK